MSSPTEIPTLPQRMIGDLSVSAIGLGCMPASWSTDPIAHDSGVAAIHAALNAGITLLDTADIYAPSWNAVGHNERLVARALHSWDGTPAQRARVVVATKGGIARRPGEEWRRNGTLDYLLRAVEASAARLGTDHIDLWQHHRMDVALTFDEQFENVLRLREQGIVRRIGLSNVNAAMVQRAIELGGSPAEGGVVSVQNERSPRYRNWSDVLELCEASGIAFLPWSPLGGSSFFAELASTYSAFGEIAAERGVSPYAVTLAWHLRSSPAIIPIPGASKPASAIDSASAAHLQLTDVEFARLEACLGESAPVDPEIDIPALRAG
jgi:aryl-alcohol dehydrogenase-like predicted oxidoreductase